MKDNKNNRMVLAVIFVASIAVIIGTVSYAYFTTDLGENTNQELVLQAGTMQLRFADNDNGVNASLNFGESATKEFILENTGTLDAKAKINFTSMTNAYLKGSLTYKLEYKTSEESTTYIEAQPSRLVPRSSQPATHTLIKEIAVPVGAKYYCRLTITLENLPDVDQTDDIGATFSSMFNIEDAEHQNTGWMQDAVVAIYNNRTPSNIKTGNPDFLKIATTDEGIYSQEDNYGTSYYYRGAVKNNYVRFAGYYWRIIRINGDGSLRIIYDGTEAHENGEASDDRVAIKNQVFNNYGIDAKYVGWMFGRNKGQSSTSKEQAQANEEDSDMKVAVDEWYKEHIADKGYDIYVADAPFCNDRSTPGRAVTGNSNDTGLGYGKNITLYGSIGRLINPTVSYWIPKNNPEPTLVCPSKNDTFTVYDTDRGNGDLTYPIGLITVDEIVLAGGQYHGAAGTTTYNNMDYYLYKGSSYWTMSPYSNDAEINYVFHNDSIGYFNATSTSNTRDVAPVINLSAEYASTLIGDGSITNPYRA